MSAESSIRAFVDAADDYLARHPGPGIADVRAGLAASRAQDFKPRRPRENAVVEAHLRAALAALRSSEPQLG